MFRTTGEDLLRPQLVELGPPEDIAHVAAWLASDHSDFIVGATLFVDGGMPLFPGFMHNG